MILLYKIDRKVLNSSLIDKQHVEKQSLVSIFWQKPLDVILSEVKDL